MAYNGAGNFPPSFDFERLSNMFKSILLAALGFVSVLPSLMGSDAVFPLTNRVRSAVSKALPTLEAGSKGSADKRQCFTCHSQAIPVFAFLAAKRHGFAVDEDNLQRQLQHTYDHLKRGLDNYRQGKGQGGDILTAGYALWTLDEGNWPADEVSVAVSNYLLGTQTDIPHWRHRGNRPPTSGSDFTATYVALRALEHFGADDQKEKIAERRTRVAEWLSSTKPIETEDLVFKIGAFQYADCASEVIQDTVSALLKIQRDDGGWGQKPDMPSDAYATATAIFALNRYREAFADDQSISKGIEYLLSTQLEDGTWHVVTRAKPVQEYFESQFPHGKDQFISVSATAWSTLALLQALNASGDRQEKELNPTESAPEVPKVPEVDKLLQDFFANHKVPGASVAITNQGEIVYSKGFGYSDVESETPVSSASIFRIASLSKPITAVAILRLAEQGKLGLDDKVFSLLGLQPKIGASGSLVDARLNDITIEQLLQHRGGWDRDKSFDPMFQSVKFAKQLGTLPPAGQHEVILAMLDRELDFAPGERFAYSNFGYCLLGRVIEKVSGLSYESYVQSNLLKPLGIRTMRVGATRLNGRVPNEVRYYANGEAKSVFQSDLGEKVPAPYGAWHLEAMDSHGGWLATAEDIVRFAAALDDAEDSLILSRESIERMHSRPNGLAGFNDHGEPKESFYSLGWYNRVTSNGELNHWHTGSLPGTSAIMIRRRDGCNMVALMNTRNSEHAKHLGLAIDPLLHAAADTLNRSR